jgi:hypothetical protein
MFYPSVHKATAVERSRREKESKVDKGLGIILPHLTLINARKTHMCRRESKIAHAAGHLRYSDMNRVHKKSGAN